MVQSWRGERVKITIDIPREYERDFSAGKFKDFFSRVIADIDFKGICGNYEKEMILSILVYTFFTRMFDFMLPLVVKYSIVAA